MYSTLTKKPLLYIISLLFSLYLFSCSDDTFTLGDKFIRSNSYTELTDTVTLSFSTIKADSVQSSSQSIALLGSYQFADLGRTYSLSYASFTKDQANTIDKAEVYDSITFVLQTSGFSLGDTLKPFSFAMHRLSKAIDNEKDVFYNTTSFKYIDNPIAEFTFSPRPSNGKKLSFKLPDELGLEFWQLIKDKVTQTVFEDNFKGLVLKTEPTLTHAMMGFTVDDSTSFVIKLHSHLTSQFTKKIVRNIGIKGSTYQFNQIINEPDNDALLSLSDSKKCVNERNTSNSAFIQGGIGYSIRIDFPFLGRLKEIYNEGRIVRATLVISPNMDYHKVSTLPSTINIASINKLNEFGSYLADGNNINLTGNLVIDPIINMGNKYTFDVTSYLNSRLSETVILPDNGLVLTLPDNEYYKTITSLAIGGFTNKTYNSKLLIYYYKYDKN